VNPAFGDDPQGRYRDEARFALPHDATAPATARTAVRTTFVRWRVLALVDDAMVAVSELVTNALRHGLPPIGLQLRRGARQVRLDVADARAEPISDGQEATVLAESGRGLDIVRTLADDVGIEAIPGDGKAVYAAWNTAERPID
jgi:anti-sigma regulatory factor (Ser/Thr protein kinase)